MMATMFKERDADGRWWEFSQQQMQMTCGPASVKTAKELFHNRKIGEDAIRASIGLEHSNWLNLGVGNIDIESADAYNNELWLNEGIGPHLFKGALQRHPLAIPNVRILNTDTLACLDDLRKASRNRPAILGFRWLGEGGGHAVVCVGPLPSDPDRFVILDPGSGLEELHADDATGVTIRYRPTYKLNGHLSLAIMSG